MDKQNRKAIIAGNWKMNKNFRFTLTTNGRTAKPSLLATGK